MNTTTTTTVPSSNKVQTALDALSTGIQAFTTGEDWKNMLEKMALAGRYSVIRFSFYNTLLCIFATGGKASYVASFDAWRKLGRFPRKGTAITILRPNFRKVEMLDSAGNPVIDSKTGRVKMVEKLCGFLPYNVFDIADTSGVSVDFSLDLPRVEDPEGFDQSFETLRKVAMEIKDSNGKHVVSKMTLRDRVSSDPSATAHGWYAPATREIVIIREDRTNAEIFDTSCHEVAHSLMHSSDSDHHARSEMEVEAESVAFVVSHALGLDTSKTSFPYVSIWASRAKDGNGKDFEKAIKASGSRIAKAAKVILDALCPETAESDSE